MILYHYRPIESALLEIGNGTLHFATRQELNDPLEGYVRVYWQGDKAAWEGLFRNYICSLSQAIDLYLLRGDEDVLHHGTLIVDLHRFDDVPLGTILHELGDEFLKDNEIQKLAAFYGNNELKVHEKELRLILLFIHRKALSICILKNRKYKIMPEEETDRLLDIFSRPKEIPLSMDQMNENLPNLEHRETIAKISEEMFEDMCDLRYIRWGFDNDDFLYGIRKDENGKCIIEDEITEARQHRNWMTIVADFPKVYVNQLKDVIYPESYVVCFSAKNNDSAMWGNYADHHRGVCLIYETDEGNKMTVKGKEQYTREIKPVKYDGEIIERNFFTSFGRLNRMQIQTWLTGINGTISNCYKAFNREEEWRKNYWAAYEVKTYQKLKAWSHENEYRFALANALYTFDNPESRNLEYDPRNLKGIIFGINTSEYDKKRIMEKLLDRADEYKEFTFYQAEYDDQKQIIMAREKRLWRIK